MKNLFCKSLTKYNRFETNIVKIGNVEMGGENPIRVQSMTNTNTLDTEATVEQCIRIIETGGELVRITTPTVKEAKNLLNIKNELRKRDYETPLAADIHFNPKIAEVAAQYVEKIRINPGNYADSKKNQNLDYSEKEYAKALHKIEAQLIPLLNICRNHNTAIRIGTNHGSLSDRIMSRYGDTPEGMVESTMEFLRICKRVDFNNIVVSLKSSNTRVMVLANRLIVQKMYEENMNYPLHLGVTEAGDGEDGRIKSAVGIGTLLNDGIGDTIRVSLSEAPEKEIPVAKMLVDYFIDREKHETIEAVNIDSYSPFKYKKRKTFAVENIGGNNFPVVISDFNCNFSEELIPEYVFSNNNENARRIADYKVWIQNKSDSVFPLFSLEEFLNAEIKSDKLNFVRVFNNEISDENIKKLALDRTVVFVLETNSGNGFADQRAFFLRLNNLESKTPVIISRTYKTNDITELQLQSASDIGALFVDGFGDGIWIKTKSGNQEIKDSIVSTAFGILQASRVRMSKTEYISCPSCGRTLFDLEGAILEIKKHTSHLKGLKIGIMGCIVNGPGEMADADYGFVGAGKGKITLYKGKEVMKKNIPSENAVQELVALIKECGDWIEKC